VDVLAKFLTFAGFVLMLGGGILALWVPLPLGLAQRRRLTVGAALGAVMVALGALLDVWGVALRFTLGEAPWGFVQLYVSGTRHGGLSAGRALIALLLAAALALWGWRAVPPPPGVALPARLGVGRALFLFGASLLLASAAAVGHSGAMGLGGALASFAHYGAVVVWAGALLAMVLLGARLSEGRLVQAVRFLSRVGPPMVALLAISGVAMARLHLNPPSAIVSSEYGTALLLKLALVAFTLLSAAYNRWVRLPRLASGGSDAAMRRALRFEAALLVAVLLATALLATQPPVH
jgi:putative copper export protein